MLSLPRFIVATTAVLIAIWATAPAGAQPVPPASIPRPPAPIPQPQSAPVQAVPPQAAPAQTAPAQSEPTAPPADTADLPVPPAPPAIEPADGVAIDWEVANRFRLFRSENDFLRHVEAARGRTIIETEQALEMATDGRGWARDVVERLCVDAVGRIAEQCLRDGVEESYLNPADHRVTARLNGTVPPGATCTWSFEDSDAKPFAEDVDCGMPVTFRVRYGKPSKVAADIAAPGLPLRRAGGEIAVRDLLIAGLGNSIASGDGNPDRPVALTDDGFCFRRFLGSGSSEYFRPSRVGFHGDRSCDGAGGPGSGLDTWAKLSARWMYGACHRSLYSYQLRAALELAIENPHGAVTFLPLACTGATIGDGLFNGRRSRELYCGGALCPSSTSGQLNELTSLLERARRGGVARPLDLVFLTVGANDINFSGLVADVMIEASGERDLFSRLGVISPVAAAQATLERRLPADFARLRATLKLLVGNDLERVVFVSYGNPALNPEGGPCPGGRAGMDVHPAFGADAGRMRNTAAFVQNTFLPALKALATCTGKEACTSSSDAMTFIDGHQAAFAAHGFCARTDTDPPFDRECFLTDGKSFTASPVEGANDPMVCNLSVNDFRAYAPRARWIRTPNDSYFAAMTFPQGISLTMEPSDIHDATWGVLSAVYGGALHPTAEGHAAMADAAVAGAKRALHLPGVGIEIISLPQSPQGAAPK